MYDNHGRKSGKRATGFKEVVVAVDDSQQSTWALQLAAQVTHGTCCRLSVVHVYDAPYVSPDLPIELDALEASAKACGESVLQKQCTTIPVELISRQILREGFAADHIIEVARELKADLIIVGTHARGRLANFVLGSTAEAIIRRAPCPVLSVAHDPAKTAAAAQPELSTTTAAH